jgi:hypothetical protein
MTGFQLPLLRLTCTPGGTKSGRSAPYPTYIPRTRRRSSSHPTPPAGHTIADSRTEQQPEPHSGAERSTALATYRQASRSFRLMGMAESVAAMTGA